MSAPPEHRSRRLPSLWRSLTRPPASLQDPIQRRHSELLASLLILLIGVCAAALLTLPLYHAGIPPLETAELYASAGSLVALTAALLMNRAGRFRAAAVVTTLTTTLAIFVVVIPHGEPDEVDAFYFLFAPMLLANVFLGRRFSIALVALMLVGMAAMSLIFPQLGEPIPALFLVLLAGLIQVIGRHQQGLEDERKRQLADNERRLRMVTDNTLDLIIQADADGVMRYCSPSIRAMLGYEPEEAVGRPLNFDLCHPDDLAHVDEAYRQAGQAGETTRVEFRYRHRGGHYVWLEAIVGPLKDADGSIGGYMLVYRDITERQQAETRRLELAVERERVKTLRQFVDHAAAHDLRTPLTIMKTSLYLLERVDDPEKRQRYLENLSSQIDHLEKVFDNILAMSQIYKVEPELHKQPIDLNQIAREVLMKEEVSAAQKHQTLTFSAEGELPVLTGDPQALGQAIAHLVRNAIQFTVAGGRIAVRTFRREESAVVEVEDNGIGIGAPDLPFIFDPFYKADAARQQRIGEMGLGLAIVRRVVEAHGGRVEVESELGKGSVFRVVLAAEGG